MCVPSGDAIEVSTYKVFVFRLSLHVIVLGYRHTIIHSCITNFSQQKNEHENLKRLEMLADNYHCVPNQFLSKLGSPGNYQSLYFHYHDLRSCRACRLLDLPVVLLWTSRKSGQWVWLNHLQPMSLRPKLLELHKYGVKMRLSESSPSLCPHTKHNLKHHDMKWELKLT